MKLPSAPLLHRWLLSLTILGPFAWFFAPVLFAPQSFVFRDAAHYYYPLFEWTAEAWSLGEVPLWNPQENCGLPVLADATSSVFYPGKLLFLLPLDFATRYKWYVAVHVLLAAWAMYRLARHWDVSPAAATLAAMSYAFSGSVLFQYCNVVFLVGAAWLPLAVLAADRMLVERRLRWSLAVALVWAMMVLGGDPQAAYHAGLLAVLQAVLRWRGEVGTPARDGRRFLRLRSRPALLAAATGAAVLLTAVQILPSLEWSAHSQRAVYEAPRSVYEVPGFLLRPADSRGTGSVARGLFGPPEYGKHQEHIYHFSVGPWRLAELVWPNFSGRLFPGHRRWTSQIPAEGRVWTPSLYLGLMPLLLGLAACRWRRGPLPVRWASWAALLGAVASFGWYGMGWLLYELRYALTASVPDEPWIGQPVGGLYWAMVVLLPGYAMFRFPAKLFVVATLGLSLLAGWGCDGICRQAPRRLRAVALGLAIVSLAAGSATWWLLPAWSCWLHDAPTDAFFGPLDVAGSLADLRIAFWQTAALGTALWLLLRLPAGRCGHAIAPLLLVLTAIDLAAAHSWLIPSAPQDSWQRPGYYAGAIRQHAGDGERVFALRIHRGSRPGWLPAAWSRSASPDRQREGLAWDVDTLFPKYHLPSGLSLAESFGTFSANDLSTTLRIARRYGVRRPDGVLEPHRGVLDALGVRYLVLPEGVAYPHTERVGAAGRDAAPPNSSLWFNPQAFPRAWIVHRVLAMPPLEASSPLAVEQRTREVWFPDGRLRDLRHQAVVEIDGAASADGQLISDSDAEEADEGAESCRVVVAQARRVEIAARLQRPGLVVLSDLYYPGWIAESRGEHEGDGDARRIPILRANRVMRGVWLPAGTHRLRFTYQPGLFRAGAAISTLAWLAIAGAGCIFAFRRLGNNWRVFR